MGEIKTRPGSEIVRQLMTGFSFKASPEACDITLGECLDLYRRMVLQETEAARNEPAAENPAIGYIPLFSGQCAAEKKETHGRLLAFRAAHGLGSDRIIADASNGALTSETVADMRGSGKYEISKWRALAHTLDRLEGHND